MTLKSKLSTAALLAVVAASGLATTSANAGWLFVPENGSTFCDDVRFSCGTTYVPQEYRRQYIPPPRHGGRIDTLPKPASARDLEDKAMSYAGGGGGGGGGAAIACA
jgi:hypothetical protein